MHPFLSSLCLSLPLLLGAVPAAHAQISLGIGIDLPGVSIGIQLPVFPELQRVPGYPVYYAPQVQGNYFYYDGLYWVYDNDDWYASDWYNGPWHRAARDVVPLFVLRVPVRYYRQPPVYFGGWRRDAPPRWDDHWGREWQQRRPGWDRWDRRAVPPPAPLPVYQRKYPQSRYPQDLERQRSIRDDNDPRPRREPVMRRDAPPPQVQRPQVQQPPREPPQSRPPQRGEAPARGDDRTQGPPRGAPRDDRRPDDKREGNRGNDNRGNDNKRNDDRRER